MSTVWFYFENICFLVGFLTIVFGVIRGWLELSGRYEWFGRWSIGIFFGLPFLFGLLVPPVFLFVVIVRAVMA